jgi:hypothetical protein
MQITTGVLCRVPARGRHARARSESRRPRAGAREPQCPTRCPETRRHIAAGASASSTTSSRELAIGSDRAQRHSERYRPGEPRHLDPGPSPRGSGRASTRGGQRRSRARARRQRLSPCRTAPPRRPRTSDTPLGARRLAPTARSIQPQQPVTRPRSILHPCGSGVCSWRARQPAGVVSLIGAPQVAGHSRASQRRHSSVVSWSGCSWRFACGSR